MLSLLAGWTPDIVRVRHRKRDGAHSRCPRYRVDRQRVDARGATSRPPADAYGVGGPLHRRLLRARRRPARGSSRDQSSRTSATSSTLVGDVGRGPAGARWITSVVGLYAQLRNGTQSGVHIRTRSIKRCTGRGRHHVRRGTDLNDFDNFAGMMRGHPAANRDCPSRATKTSTLTPPQTVWAEGWCNATVSFLYRSADDGRHWVAANVTTPSPFAGGGASRSGTRSALKTRRGGGVPRSQLQHARRDA